jgi:hypothetical protein
MNEEILTESSCTATINASIEFVDIPAWLFTLPDAEYQRSKDVDQRRDDWGRTNGATLR